MEGIWWRHMAIFNYLGSHFHPLSSSASKEIEHMKSRKTKRYRYKTLALTLLRQQKLENYIPKKNFSRNNLL